MRLKITLGNITDEYEQHQSIIASIEFEKSCETFVLDSRPLDNEDEQADLDVVHGFVGVWEGRAEEEDMMFEMFGIDNLIHELEQEVEQQKVDEEKTMKRCED
jgi:hypothetical protein